MTDDHPDLLALRAAVLAAPADDVPRLAYADRLEELDGTCPACTDKTGFVWGKVADCRTCHGSGSNHFAERAEAMRMQGRWEWATHGTGPWRLYWRVMAVPWDKDPYSFIGNVEPPKCQRPDCRSGHPAGLSFGGLFVCWQCGARAAREGRFQMTGLGFESRSR